MYDSFGSTVFGGKGFGGSTAPVGGGGGGGPSGEGHGGSVVVLGDTSSHGGTMITTNQDNRLTVAGLPVAVAGALHSCPIPGHGITTVAAVTVRSFANDKLIITKGAAAGCGAILLPPDRKVYVES